MSLVPITPVWTIVHVFFKYPGLSAIAALSIYGGSEAYDAMGMPPLMALLESQNTNVASTRDQSYRPMLAITSDDGQMGSQTLALPDRNYKQMVPANFVSIGPEVGAGLNQELLIPHFVSADWHIELHTEVRVELARKSDSESVRQKNKPSDLLQNYMDVTNFYSP